jgi:hypothetical protein
MDMCVVCQEEIHSDRKKIQCGHTFHYDCLLPIESKKCPLCRSKFTLFTTIKLDGGKKIQVGKGERVYQERGWLYISNGNQITFRGKLPKA